MRYVSVEPGTGYGDAAEQYITGLRQAGVPVTWTAWHADQERLPQATNADILDASTAYDTLVVHLNPADHGVWLDADPDAVTLGMFAWETDSALPGWRAVFDRLDMVLVPSTLTRALVRRTGTPTPVEVLPHIARTAEPVPGASLGPIRPDDFVFYTMGPWHNRKAIPETVRAFLDTFTADEEVALVIKTSTLDYGAVQAAESGEAMEGGAHAVRSWWTLARLLRAYPNPPRILLHCNFAERSEIDQLHTRADCFVSLTRGEAWGLACFDAGLFGNPSIITGWGGHLDYLGPDYPLLVDYQLVPSTTDSADAFGMTLRDDARWAKADGKHAGALMRQVFENREMAAQIGAGLRRRLAAEYSQEAVTYRFVALLAESHRSRAVEGQLADGAL